MAVYHFLFLFIVLISHFHQPASTTLTNSTDFESLLAFKSHVSDPYNNVFSNWTTDTSFCNWLGVTCGSKHKRVVSLNLHSYSLQGAIPPQLGNLSFLSYLDLSNNSFVGSIPHSLSDLRRLTVLALEHNYLTGAIPTSLFNSSSLMQISFLSNNLTGSLPSNDSIMLPQLVFFSVLSNHLTGPIPSGFINSQQLQNLSLSHNFFSGSIPNELGYLPCLSRLSLANNELSGMMPKTFGNLTELTLLDVNLNRLEGEIQNLNNLRKLSYINLASNHLTGSIPLSLLNVSSLKTLSLSANNLSGSVPATLGMNLPSLEILYLGDNKLSGGLDFVTSLSNCINLTSVEMFNNELDGIIPNSVRNLSTRLRYFNFVGNKIKGDIPSAFGNLSALLLLHLGRNELNGEIPVELGRMKSLQLLYLANNKISGSIPSELGLMKSLNVLNLEQNELSGSIPDTISNLTGLQILSLSCNKLSSSIPANFVKLQGLIGLNLSRNMLEGTVPLQFGNLNALDTLDLSKNQLSGNIPVSFGEMQKITYLDVSDNSLQGEIPESLSKLFSIEYLNLSHNLLSGSIPESLKDLRHLRSLDFSFNKLEGKIPTGGVFSNSTILNLEGNKALCGAPNLNIAFCSSKHGTSNTKKHHFLKYILPPIAAAAILIACFFFVLKYCSNRQAKIPSKELPVYSESYKSITYNEIVRATNKFSESNLLGKGNFSTVYKASLDDGSTAAVKILNLDLEEALDSFDVECRALSTLRHRNLVKIISTCSNTEFKALILQYMSNGTLDQWLHSGGENLNLLQRINIMIDVSLALEYLHHHHHNIVVHCDLKPSNVLLDENIVAYVSDFGIAKILLNNGKTIATTNAPGTIGYIAPEYLGSANVTRRSDVYSFGILVLETITGKKPTDSMFHAEFSLRQWISNAYPDAILDIIDSKIPRDDSIDATQTHVQNNVHQCLASIIELGLKCSCDSPDARMLMKDVVPSLQMIKADYLSTLPNIVEDT